LQFAISGRLQSGFWGGDYRGSDGLWLLRLKSRAWRERQDEQKSEDALSAFVFRHDVLLIAMEISKKALSSLI